MTEDELKKARQKLPCDYLRYYGMPKGILSFEDELYIGYHKQEKEEKELRKNRFEYPDNLTENELLDFIYLRACVYLKEKPIGTYDGNAGICAKVLQRGGGLLDAYDAGADVLYVAALSSHSLNSDLQREIIDAHIPF